MSKELSLERVQRTLNLYKEAFNKSHISVADLSKELGVKVTELMGFIKDNKIFFDLFKSRSGIFVENVFLKLEEVKGTDEYVKFMKDKYKDTIFLETFRYHSVTLFKHLQFMEGSPDRFNEWANTPEKVEKISKYLYTEKSRMDYFSPCEDIPNVLRPESIERLTKEGWKFIINYK